MLSYARPAPCRRPGRAWGGGRPSAEREATVTERTPRPDIPDEPAKPPLSPAMEDYLRAIYDLGRDGAPVSTTALAQRIGVAPASVTGMIKRLHALRLLDHEPYAGVTLTPPGLRVAIELVRHHRIIETYLAEAMGLGWDAVHDEAHRLEHHVSPALGERMAELLGHPERDPHGAPIPPRDGPFVEPAYGTLAEAEPGERLVVREVADEDAGRLRQLDRLGLRPDAALTVVAAGPEPGAVRVRVGGGGAGGGGEQGDDGECVLEPELARAVFVARAAGEGGDEVGAGSDEAGR